jgi:CTP:molybdopterin cytidylyltransferase MocA
MRLSGIVLAAGAGERMGGPKALLVIEGEPLARVHTQRLAEAGCAPIVLVTRGELAGRFAADAMVAVSTAPDPAGSLAVGLGALRLDPDDVLVITPVDAWPACTETIGRLIEAVRGGADAATPTLEGKGGHPVVLRASVLLGYRDAPRPLRDVLNALPRRVRIVVDDPAITVDLDTPEDVERMTGQGPVFVETGA